MNCKNCNQSLSTEAKFCNACGAKVVHERITFKHILADLYTKAFGWDNKLFVTIRKMITRPEIVLESYIDGVRKKFTPPLSFFAIGAAISLLVLSQFPEQHLAMNSMPGESQTANIAPKTGEEDQLAGSQQEQAAFNRKMQKAIMGNWNVVSFLLLPIYTLIAYWVFGGPYNYGEHLVINSYIQGITFLMLTIIFLVSLLTSPRLYGGSQFLMIFYYSFAYARLYKQSFGQAMLKLLKFLGIMLLISIVMFGIGLLINLLS